MIKTRLEKKQKTKDIMRVLSLLVLVAAMILAISAPANAAIEYSFTCITPNIGVDAAAGASQLKMTVDNAGWLTDGGVSRQLVSFTFHNSGSSQMTVAEIYFDDGTLLKWAPSPVASTAGVNFTWGTETKPGELPGGTDLDVPFDTTVFYQAEAKKESDIIASADAGSNAPTNGLNPGESLTLTIELKDGKTYEDTIEAFKNTNYAGAEDSLRVGLHVINFADGNSASFVNGSVVIIPPAPPVLVPEPASIIAWSLLAGAAGLGALGRRRKIGWSDENRRSILDVVGGGRAN